MATATSFLFFFFFSCDGHRDMKRGNVWCRIVIKTSVSSRNDMFFIELHISVNWSLSKYVDLWSTSAISTFSISDTYQTWNTVVVTMVLVDVLGQPSLDTLLKPGFSDLETNYILVHISVCPSLESGLHLVAYDEHQQPFLILYAWSSVAEFYGCKALSGIFPNGWLPFTWQLNTDDHGDIMMDAKPNTVEWQKKMQVSVSITITNLWTTAPYDIVWNRVE